MVEQAEETVRDLGFQIFRVRYLRDGNGTPAAKLQIAPSEMHRLPTHWPKIQASLIAIGFGAAFWDPAGYQPPARKKEF